MATRIHGLRWWGLRRPQYAERMEESKWYGRSWEATICVFVRGGKAVGKRTYNILRRPWTFEEYYWLVYGRSRQPGESAFMRKLTEYCNFGACRPNSRRNQQWGNTEKTPGRASIDLPESSRDVRRQPKGDEACPYQAVFQIGRERQESDTMSTLWYRGRLHVGLKTNNIATFAKRKAECVEIDYSSMEAQALKKERSIPRGRNYFRESKTAVADISQFEETHQSNNVCET